VNELVSLGLRPSVLQKLLEQGDHVEEVSGSDSSHDLPMKTHSLPRVVYEFCSTPNSVEPRLRLRVKANHQISQGLLSYKEFYSNSEAESSESLDDVTSYTQITSPKCVSIII
jgi:hypothetical protein